MDAVQASQVLQRLQVLEQAATEQLNARRGAERALVEAQTRITQLDQALQQGGRPGTAAGQVVDTRVLGRPDKWDGSEKDMAQLEFRDESLRGSHRSSFVGGHDDCGMQYGCYEQRYDDGREKGKECAVVFRLDHAVHRKSSGSHCKCTTRLVHGGVANALSSVLSKEQCETCCDDARSVGVSFGHKRCGEQSGDDGTEDQRVREIREHRNSGIPEDWHRDSSGRRRTDENASQHELAQVGNIPGHQNGSDKRQASPECSEGEIGRRNGRGCFHERIQRCFQRFWQETGLRSSVLVLREERSSSFRLSQEAKGQRQWKVERIQERRQQREEQQGKVQRQMLQVWQDRSHVERIADPKKRVHSKLATSWQRQDASKWQASI